MADIRLEERRFRSWDGTELFYRAWHPVRPQKRAVIVIHGGHEHSGRFTPVVDALDLGNVSFFCWDARGHGRSSGRRGFASSFRDLVSDADSFVREVSAEYEIAPEDMALMAHSEGSVIASSLVLDRGTRFRGMVLGSPALRVKLYVPFGVTLLRAVGHVRPEGTVRGFVASRFLTHDPTERELRANDPLIAHPIGVKALLGLLDEGKRIVEEASRIRIPALVLSAGSDWIVRLSAQREFFGRLGSSQKEHVIYPGFYHEVFHETERQRPIARSREFLGDLLGGA